MDDLTQVVSGVGDSPRRSVEESARREHLILAQIKGELHPYVGAQRGLVGSGDYQIPQKNIAMFFSLSLL